MKSNCYNYQHFPGQISYEVPSTLLSEQNNLFPETPRTEIPWTQTPAPLDTDPPGQRPPDRDPTPGHSPPCGQADTCDYGFV